MNPDTPAPKRRRSALPLGLLGMLLLVSAVEGWVRRHDFALLKVDDWDWRLAGEAAGRHAARADLICFGDSLIKAGLAPAILEARTGLRSYNLAVGGGQAPAAYFLLRRVLESGGRPKVLVVEFFPKLLELKPRHNIDHWPHMLDARESLDLGLATRDGELLGSMLVARTLPSVRSRYELRRMIGAALAGHSDVGPNAGFPMVRVFRQSRGAFPFFGRALPEFDLAGWIDSYFRFDPKDAVNLDYLRRFLDLAESREIPVVWLIPPLMPDLLAECERSGFDRALTEFVRGLQDEHPGLRVVDARRSGFEEAVFYDPHHLEYRGAYALSDALGKLLAADPPRADAAARWLDLPRIDEPPAQVTLEDLQAPARR
jgi:hypothetical protein